MWGCEARRTCKNKEEERAFLLQSQGNKSWIYASMDESWQPSATKQSLQDRKGQHHAFCRKVITLKALMTDGWFSLFRCQTPPLVKLGHILSCEFSKSELFCLVSKIKSGKYRIFLSLRFYVKSKLLFGVSNSAILTHWEDLKINCLWIFILFEGWKLPNEHNSEPQKWQKMHVKA